MPAPVSSELSSCLLCDNAKIFRRVDSNSDAALLQSDISNLDAWSTSSDFVSNQEKCKWLRITRQTQPECHPYKIKDKKLTVTSEEKDLEIWVISDPTWSKHVLERCAKANKLLSFLRRCGSEITSIRTRRTLNLSIVRLVLGYASIVWSPQSIELITRTECVQRRASKFILKLPFLCAVL